MRSNSQQIVSYCLGLRTQNPGLREVDLEPSPKRGSDKIKMLKNKEETPKRKQVASYSLKMYLPVVTLSKEDNKILLSYKIKDFKDLFIGMNIK